MRPCSARRRGGAPESPFGVMITHKVVPRILEIALDDLHGAFPPLAYAVQCLSRRQPAFTTTKVFSHRRERGLGTTFAALAYCTMSCLSRGQLGARAVLGLGRHIPLKLVEQQVDFSLHA